MAKLINTVNVAPLSDKYIQYFKLCKENRINVLEGAYRAGKSVLNVISFANHIDYCKDKLHLATGASASSARLNISDCNGFGLSYYFKGRCRTGKYEGNECLRIKTRTGAEKIVIFAGGKNSDSYKKIQGLSFGSWIGVELANHYISNDDKNFVRMAMSRLTQSFNQKVWWDLNPVQPSHPIYTKYLDIFERDGTHGGYNFMKCTLFDNNSLDEVQKANALSAFPDENSMEYQRYILGNRACAEGLIFSQFAKDSSNWVVDDVQDILKYMRCDFISIGVDFGGNGSNTTFVASMLMNGKKNVHVLASDKIDMSGGNSDSQEFRKRFKEFLLYIIGLGVGRVAYIFGDCADPVMINEIRNVLREMYATGFNGEIRVLDCKKHTIKKRIDTKNMLLNYKCYSINSKATTVINSTKLQVWDSRVGHEDERLDNGSVDIDTADAEEYSWSMFLDDLIRGCKL